MYLTSFTGSRFRSKNTHWISSKKLIVLIRRLYGQCIGFSVNILMLNICGADCKAMILLLSIQSILIFSDITIQLIRLEP